MQVTRMYKSIKLTLEICDLRLATMKNKYLNTTQMQTLENHAFNKYPITLAQMMQNAGKAVFDVVMNEVLPNISQSAEGGQSLVRVLVVAGKGNNGGDALVTARLLAEQGIDVTVYSPFEADDFSEMARIELNKVLDTR